MSEMTRRVSRITDATIKSLKPAPAGKRVAVLDLGLPGFRVETTDTGASSLFLVFCRFGGSRSPFAAERWGSRWRARPRRGAHLGPRAA